MNEHNCDKEREEPATAAPAKLLFEFETLSLGWLLLKKSGHELIGNLTMNCLIWEVSSELVGGKRNESRRVKNCADHNFSRVVLNTELFGRRNLRVWQGNSILVQLS